MFQGVPRADNLGAAIWGIIVGVICKCMHDRSLKPVESEPLEDVLIPFVERLNRWQEEILS